MLPGERPDTIDTRIILRIYAALALLCGSIMIGWGPAWIGTPALTRVFAAVLTASGCWAAMLSQVGDSALYRNGLMWFAAGHYIVLFVAAGQRSAIWAPRGVTASVVWDTLTILAILFFAVLTNYSVDRVGRRYQPPSIAGDGPAEHLRSSYERQIRLAGAQEERNRLARDLHDSIKQQIFVIQTAAATAQTRFDKDRPGAALALGQVRSSARDAMTEMEVMMDQLRSVPLENAGLVEALKKQCEALGLRTGAHVEFRLGGLPPNETLAPGSQQAIFRVAQEALANVGRHARAANVTVALDSFSDRLELRVQDDGIGFDPFQSQRGMGIANMRARAGEFGGKLDLTSRPGGGTTVVFSLPHVAVVPPVVYGKRALSYGAVFVAILMLSIWKKSDSALFAILIAAQSVRYGVAWYRTRNLGGETA